MPSSLSTQDRIRLTCTDLADFLCEKNESYGNSALDPVRIFSRSPNDEQILVRIDDKLSRIQRGKEYPGDETIKDLIGYLILLLIQKDTPTPTIDEQGHAWVKGRDWVPAK